MSEENYLLGEPENSLYAYAMTKRMLLVGLKSLQKQYNLKWLYFVPSTLYGPGFELEDNHFIFDFIRNCYLSKFDNKDFIIWGNGEQRRELIYVEDAINIMLSLINKENEIYNLGSGEDCSINEFAKKVCDVYEYDFKMVKHDLKKYIGAKQKKLDTKKVENLLYPNSIVDIDLETGLKISIDYFIKNWRKND
jgi:GDP-L-fucose synthase